MPNTPAGFPYPNPDVYVSDLPAAIQGLAQAVDGRLLGGWTNLAMQTPFTSQTAAYTVRNGGVSLRGAAVAASGLTASTWVTLGVLPAGARPSTQEVWPAASTLTVGTTRHVRVTTAGLVQVYAQATSEGVSLATIRFWIG